MNYPSIHGREREIRTLESFFQSPTSEFLAIYGRRRIGKTYLIREFVSEQGKGSKTSPIFFDVTGTRKGKLRTQLSKFELRFKEVFHISLPISFESWQEAFAALTEQVKATNKVVVVFLDELPWLATPKSNLLGELDYFWNSQWNKLKNLKLVICGSAAAWMIEKVIEDKGGLHNRTTYRIQLNPFDLRETRAYLQKRKVNYSTRQVIEIYLAIGGVAFYLNGIEPKLSPQQNIENLCFTEGGLLVQEYDLLFASLFKNSEKHLKLIDMLSSKRQGLDRKSIEKKFPGTSARLLKQLEAAGFIKKYIPFGFKERESYYRVIDEYTLFYKSFIQDTVGALVGKSENYWLKLSQTQKYRIWSGYSFENLCQKHVQAIIRKLSIAGMLVNAHTWSYRGKNERAQIDLLLDRSDGVINLIEIKNTKLPLVVDKKLYEEVKKRAAVFLEQSKTRKDISWILISSSGVKENHYSEELFVECLVAEDLFL